MGRPLLSILIFMAVGSAIVFLSGQAPLPQVGFDTELGNQTTYEATPEGDDIESSDLLFSTFKCFVLGPVLFFNDCATVTTTTAGALFGFDSDITKAIKTVTDGIGALIAAVSAFLTFNVPGAPSWVRYLWSVPLNGTLIYIIVSLIRGAG